MTAHHPAHADDPDADPVIGPRRAGRTKRSGAVTKLGPNRWLIGVEGSRDPITGARRRHTQVVRGSKADAEVALARLKLRANDAVLERGTRLDEQVAGHGLGLGVVRDSVEAWGGSLQLQDSPLGGLRVAIELSRGAGSKRSTPQG